MPKSNPIGTLTVALEDARKRLREIQSEIAAEEIAVLKRRSAPADEAAALALLEQRRGNVQKAIGLIDSLRDSLEELV